MKKLNFYTISLKRNILPITFFIFTIALVVFSKSNLSSAKAGLTLWATAVVPSLFPFFIATELLSYTNIIHIIGKLLNKFMRPIFNVPGEGAFAFIIGLISGYPVGAKVVCKLFHDGLCTKSEAERMLSFTNNSADRGSLSWLYTVSKNEALNYLRKNKQFVNIEEIYEIKEETDEIEKIIDVHTYNKIINGLNEKEKEIVSLKILSNFTFKKIGQLLKMPTATVQWKYYKAVDSLKISLGNLAMFMITFIVLVVKNKILTNKDSNSIQENNQIEINEKESNVRENESLKATSSADTFECIVPAESSESSIEIDKEENITDGVLISFCGIFLMFFIIFSIFFKNRQQKRRKKRLNNVNIKK